MAKDKDAELRADIAEAKARMRSTFGSNREISKLMDHLWEGETVRRMTRGTYAKGTGLVTLTDRRLLFTLDGLMSRSSEDFPLDKVSSVQFSSMLGVGTITVFASGNKVEIKNIVADDGKAIVDDIRAAILGPKAAPAEASVATAAAAVPDVMGQLEQLGKLRDAGVLTSDEFDAKKAELLARL